MGAARKRQTDPNLEWFAKADFRRYKGRYVAIVGRRVVASGKNAKRVYEQAERRHPDQEVMIWKVIDEDLLIL